MTSKHAMRRSVIGNPSNLPDKDPLPLSANVRRGALWSIAATLLLRLTSIFVTAVVAHILDRSQFGVFTIALTAYTIVIAVGELGLASCLTRADLDIDSLAPTMVTVSLTTNAIQASAMYAFAKPIATALGSAAAADSIRVMAIAAIIAGIVAVPDCQLIRNFKQKNLFMAQVCGSVPSIIVLLVLAKSGFGAIAYAWSMVAGLFFSTCVVITSVPKYYLPGIKRSALSVLFRLGVPLGGANIVNSILLNVDFALIGHFVGAGALGAYVLAFNVASWPASLLANVVNWLSMPVFSRVKRDADLLKQAVAGALRSISLIVMPISALTIAISRSLILTLYGPKWAASAEVLAVLALYGGASIVCVLFANILAGLGLSKSLFAIQLAWLITLFLAMILGIYWKGIVGAAIAHVIVVTFLVIPCYLIALKRRTGIRFIVLGRAILPALLAALAAALAAKAAELQFTNSVAQLATGLAAGGTVYIAAVTPQAIELLNRGQATKPYAVRILRIYNRTARLVGLPGYNPARHSYRGGVQLAPGRSRPTVMPSVAHPRRVRGGNKRMDKIHDPQHMPILGNQESLEARFNASMMAVDT